MLARLRSWLKIPKAKPIDELFEITFDDSIIKIRVSEELESASNQEIDWARIRRVCFKDGGMLSSDILYLSLDGPEQVVAVPTEAKGGSEFFGAICERGLLPEPVWRRAVGDTSGGLHCWPEGELPANNGFNRTPESSGPAKPGEFGGGAG